MPIIFPSPPEKAAVAVDAFLGDPSLDAITKHLHDSAPLLIVPNGQAVFQLIYPHVHYTLSDPESALNLAPYEWQFIYSTAEGPGSFEVEDGTTGESESVAWVTGLPLTEAIVRIAELISRDGFDDEYILKLLHIRGLDSRAIVLQHAVPDRSLAFPLGGGSEGLREMPLGKYLDDLRRIAERRDQDGHEGVPHEMASRDEAVPTPKHQSTTDMSIIKFQALDVIGFDIRGDLNSLAIGPLPTDTDVIESDSIIINAALPDLGSPAQLAPANVAGSGGPGGGQYIEVLIDDQARSGRVTAMVPYAMHFIPVPLDSPEPVPEELLFGSHILHFIVSSGDGLCVKDPGYAASRVVHVRKKDNDDLNADGPIIIYNLPRASHFRDDVTVDFALLNVDLDEADPDGRVRITHFQVQALITTEEGVFVTVGMLNYYHPYRVTGLEPGDYNITLALVARTSDHEQELEDQPYSRCRPRAFTVHADLPPTL